MLRLYNIKAAPEADMKALIALCAERLAVNPSRIKSLVIVKKSVDARDRSSICCVYTLDAEVPDETRLLSRLKRGAAERAPAAVPPKRFRHRFTHPPVVAGAGPAGLFAAWLLAENGAEPILIERGKDIAQRSADVEAFFQGGALLPESNVQFGEGGAGAFSDGKLATGTRNPRHRLVLETLASCGAPEDILFLSKPHIGTDKLKTVVETLRGRILALGGAILFNTKLSDIRTTPDGLKEITLIRDGQQTRLPCESLILATGHSARDTYGQLYARGVRMEAKPFAVGVRIEHLQACINAAQYGSNAPPALGAADYRLNAPTPDKRGVYTFCMCPGGTVIAAASETGGVATNGMSLYARNGKNANAALLVGVTPEDFGDCHPLAGLRFQRDIEAAAFSIGGEAYRAPCQRVEDFLADRVTRALGEVLPTYRPGVAFARLDDCLPAFVTENLRLGIMALDRKLPGFACPDALLTGVETRTSSPVRIPRDVSGQANIRGLFPAGEGAGYAGGIMSSAADGLTAAEQAMERSISAE
jgi:uncharacterized FAD-dependent dehydrogenase